MEVLHLGISDRLAALNHSPLDLMKYLDSLGFFRPKASSLGSCPNQVYLAAPTTIEYPVLQVLVASMVSNLRYGNLVTLSLRLAVLRIFRAHARALISAQIAFWTLSRLLLLLEFALLPASSPPWMFLHLQQIR